MRWLVPVVILLACPAARGNDCGTTVVGKVVSVPDGGSMWVYLEHARACYHVALAGVQAPAVDQPLGASTRDALSKMVLGREVTVTVPQLCEVGATAGTVVLDGQSVNTQIASLLAASSVQNVVVHEMPLRRPLLAFCQALRQWVSPTPGLTSLAGR
jgi:hypothetical protein